MSVPDLYLVPPEISFMRHDHRCHFFCNRQCVAKFLCVATATEIFEVCAGTAAAICNIFLYAADTFFGIFPPLDHGREGHYVAGIMQVLFLPVTRDSIVGCSLQNLHLMHRVKNCVHATSVAKFFYCTATAAATKFARAVHHNQNFSAPRPPQKNCFAPRHEHHGALTASLTCVVFACECVWFCCACLRACVRACVRASVCAGCFFMSLVTTGVKTPSSTI